MAKRVTISDLARALSLSPTLISMVLNGKGDQNKISKDTQKRVLEMAEKMGYTPNASARALRTGKSHVIGLVVPDISNSFYASLAKKFEDLLMVKGYRLIIGSTDEVPEKEIRLNRVLVDQNVDGIIVASTMPDSEAYMEIVTSGKPVILFDRLLPGARFSSVTVENRSGAEKAIDLLHESGRKYIGFLTLTPNYLSTLQDRMKGFIQASKSYGVSQPENRILEIEFSEISSRFNERMSEFLKQHPDMDALLVANNNLAFHFMKFVKSSNEERVKKMAFISFDDHFAFELYHPGVTAIAQPIDDIATTAVDLLLQSLNSNETVPKEVHLPVKLIRRSSH